MKPLIINVLKSRFFIVPAIIITGIIAGIMVYFTQISDKVIFPNSDNFKYNPYNDEAAGGHSQILEHVVTDSLLKLHFRLNEGFQSPFVGVCISPLQNQYIRAGRYNQITLQLKGTNIKRIGISLFTRLSDSSEYQNTKEGHYFSYLNISNKKNLYNIPFKQFVHPQWWEDKHHISSDKREMPDKNKILYINIGSAYTPIRNDKKSLEIYSLSFSRNNRQLFTLLGFTEAGFLLLLGFVNYIVSRKKQPFEPVTVFYKPVTDVQTQNHSIEQCFEYLNNHFSNSNLSLNLVSEATSLSQRQITSAIHTKFNCNFKTYINRIRITEAKRLLESTELNIGEIAYKVGFTNWGKMFYYWGNGYHSTTNPDRNATWGEEATLDNMMHKMKTQFVDKGIPVILGEFGVIRRANLSGEDLELHLASRAYYLKYLMQQAKANGILPFYWDAGYMGDNSTALFNRHNNTVYDQQALDALMEGIKE